MKINCDVCGLEADAPEGEHEMVPTGWYYGEFIDDDGVSYLMACSPDCVASFWKKGPGDLREGLQPGQGMSQLPCHPDHLATTQRYPGVEHPEHVGPRGSEANVRWREELDKRFVAAAIKPSGRE